VKKVPPSVARRYARALLQAALEKQAAESLEQELAAAAAHVQKLPELKASLLNPALGAESKKKLAQAVWAKASPLFRRLLELLIDRGRVGILPALHGSYLALLNEQRGVVAAEAVSAVPLAPGQEKALTAAAAKLAGREVSLKASVDPSLLGGVVLHMEGRTYDGSVRTKLRTLRVRLGAGATSSSLSPRH
jgi:F-type H+-transporting ATPase subunit delta